MSAPYLSDGRRSGGPAAGDAAVAAMPRGRAPGRGALPIRTLAIYAFPAFSLSIMLGPAGSIIQGIYTRDLGLKLADIANLILIARLLDAFTDPLIGYASDATKGARWGRKLWIVAGAIMSLVGISWLYFPPQGVTPLYFFLSFVASFLGWTLVEIPHLAWGTEITRTYDERSRVFSFRFGATFSGLFVFLAIPLLASLYKHFFAGLPFDRISLEYSRETLHAAFWIVAVTLPIAVTLASFFVPPRVDGSPTVRNAHSLHRLLAAFGENKPFRIFALVMALFGFATGMQMGIAYLHLSSYLQLANWAAIIYVVCLPFNVLSTFLWLRAAKHLGKHRAFALGGAVNATLFVALGFLSPGPWALPGYFIVFGLVQWIQGCWYALPPAILSDVCDYSSFKTGKDSTATYFAAYVFIMKCTQGLGTGIGFAITAAFGFNPAVNVQSASAAFSLKMVMGFVPAVLVYAASLIVYHFPITRSRHDTIRKKLERSSRAAPKPRWGDTHAQSK
jgi:Na+/melibiose symporter-like transporter